MSGPLDNPKGVRCVARVRDKDSHWPRYHQCQRTATVVLESGAHYCKQHSPDARKARQATNLRKWEEKFQATRAPIERAQAIERAAYALIAERDAFDGQDTLDTLDGAIAQLRTALGDGTVT